MKATVFFSSLSKHNTTEYECRAYAPHSPTPRHHLKNQPPSGKENCFWPQIQVCRYSNAFLDSIFKCHTKKKRGGTGGV